MIVGGIANAVWGEPRATIDVDVTVSVENPDLSTAIADLDILARWHQWIGQAESLGWMPTDEPGSGGAA